MIILNKEQTLNRKEEIISAIKAGMIFIYPTDTIYGMGCDATNENAVQKLRDIKNREAKPFSVIAPNKDWIKANYNVRDESTLDKLPGPFTLIFNRGAGGEVAKNVFFDALPGVRIPNNWFTDLVSASGIPFVTTSVNITGQKNMEALEDVPQEFLEKIDYVIYDGPIHGKQSTRIDLTG